MNHHTLALDPLVAALERDRSSGDFAGLTSNDRAAREEILHRAYAIWESEGHPANRELSNWVQAETGILGNAKAASANARKLPSLRVTEVPGLFAGSQMIT